MWFLLSSKTNKKILNNNQDSGHPYQFTENNNPSETGKNKVSSPIVLADWLDSTCS